MKTKIWIALKYILALFLIYGGVQHFLKPEFYLAFVPDFLFAKMLIIYASGFLEILFGVLLLIPKYSYYGALGIIALMLIFLPIHIGDIFSDTPAIGSTKAAYIRLPIQFLLIWISWKVSQMVKKD
ncbi:Uncharacterized membrane protein [Spirosomataceae bacterium TFI 002]|nr:Uncharacterized membrane protein [Spirosomataceae bacterium TFI 002]